MGQIQANNQTTLPPQKKTKPNPEQPKPYNTQKNRTKPKQTRIH